MSPRKISLITKGQRMTWQWEAWLIPRPTHGHGESKPRDGAAVWGKHRVISVRLLPEMHVLCLDTGEPRETQTQDRSSVCSHLSICMWPRGNPEKPRPRIGPQSAVMSVCVRTRGNPEKPRPRIGPQSAVMSVRGKTQTLPEGEGG